jgi:hypothetical protein
LVSVYSFCGAMVQLHGRVLLNVAFPSQKFLRSSYDPHITVNSILHKYTCQFILFDFIALLLSVLSKFASTDVSLSLTIKFDNT